MLTCAKNPTRKVCITRRTFSNRRRSMLKVTLEPARTCARTCLECVHHCRVLETPRDGKASCAYALLAPRLWLYAFRHLSPCMGISSYIWLFTTRLRTPHALAATCLPPPLAISGRYPVPVALYLHRKRPLCTERERKKCGSGNYTPCCMRAFQRQSMLSGAQLTCVFVCTYEERIV